MAFCASQTDLLMDIAQETFQLTSVFATRQN